MSGRADKIERPWRLIVMRHAKSSWDSPGVRDHDRPLNRRGRLAAPLMACWLREVAAELALEPLDRAYVSDSRRTRETWALVSPIWGAEAAVRFEPALYEATPQAIWSVIAASQDDARTMLTLGHNPGLQLLLADLTGKPFPRFPTAAVAVLSAAKPWNKAAPGDFRIEAYEEPKSLV